MPEMAPIQMEDWMQMLPGLLWTALIAFVPVLAGLLLERRGKTRAFLVLGLVWALLVWAITLPSIRPARSTARRNSCIANLKILAEAKRSWAALTKPESTVAAQPADLAPYLKQGQLPVCPTGGTYTLGAVNEPPRCSHADKGHALTPPR